MRLEKGVYTVKKDDREQFLRDADEGGLRDTKGRIFSKWFSEYPPYDVRDSHDTLIFHYGTGLDGFGYDMTHTRVKPLLDYSPSRNQPLLDWAVKNIEGWEAGFTHLRCDSSKEAFYTVKGEWYSKDGRWSTGYPYDGYKVLTEIGDELKVYPQAISKEDWEAAKKVSEQKPSKEVTPYEETPKEAIPAEFTLDDIECGKHLIKTDNGSSYIKLQDGLYLNIEGGWNDGVLDRAIAVYSLKPDGFCFNICSNEYRTLLWAKDGSHKVNPRIEELKAQIKAAQEEIDKLENEKEG